MILLNLLWINIIIVLIHLSGFIDNLDAAIYKHFKPYHLPHILQCALCSVWWLSLIFVVFSGQFTLINVMLCLVNAHLTEITIPLITLIKNYLLKIIEIMNTFLW